VFWCGACFGEGLWLSPASSVTGPTAVIFSVGTDAKMVLACTKQEPFAI